MRRLSGYGVGEATHPALTTYAREIASQIKLISRSRVSLLVLVTGSADGTPNKGLNLPLQSFPQPCVNSVTLPVNDRELALLRGCIAREYITANLPRTGATSILYQSNIDDKPDGYSIGGIYRSVQVEVYER